MAAINVTGDRSRRLVNAYELKAVMVCLRCKNCALWSIPERFRGELLTMGRYSLQLYLPLLLLYFIVDGWCYRTGQWRRLYVAMVIVTSHGHPRVCCVYLREPWGSSLSRPSTTSNSWLAVCSMNPHLEVTDYLTKLKQQKSKGLSWNITLNSLQIN